MTRTGMKTTVGYTNKMGMAIERSVYEGEDGELYIKDGGKPFHINCNKWLMETLDRNGHYVPVKEDYSGHYVVVESLWDLRERA